MDQPEVDARFEQLRRVRMPQRVHMGALGHARLQHRAMERGLEAGAGDRPGRRHDAIDLPLSGVRGKEPLRRAMRPPVVAQQREGRLRQGDVAVVLPLPGHMDEPAGPVHLGHLETRALQEPQATGVDRNEADPVDGKAHEVKDAPDLLAAEHGGQLVRVRRAHQRQARERFAERVLDKELDVAQGDRDGGPRIVLDLGEMEEVLAEVLVGDQVRRFAEVLGQLADGADVSLLGARRERAELHVLEHALAQRCHGGLLSAEREISPTIGVSSDARWDSQTEMDQRGLPYPPQAD